MLTRVFWTLFTVETIAIFGQGPVGLSATQLAVEMGARVIAIDIAPERRKLAQQFGAHHVIDPSSVDMVAAIRDLTHGEGAHKTLDASSAPEARAAAVRSVRSWGTACFVGERGQVTLDVSPDLLRRQVTLVGSWAPPSLMSRTTCPAGMVSIEKLPSLPVSVSQGVLGARAALGPSMRAVSVIPGSGRPLSSTMRPASRSPGSKSTRSRLPLSESTIERSTRM